MDAERHTLNSQPQPERAGRVDAGNVGEAVDERQVVGAFLRRAHVPHGLNPQSSTSSPVLFLGSMLFYFWLYSILNPQLFGPILL